MKNNRVLHLNLLGEFIKKKLYPEFLDIILLDCGNFIVIKGKTSSKNIIKLSDVVDEFKKFYSIDDSIRFNTIDLIEYSKIIFHNMIRVKIIK